MSSSAKESYDCVVIGAGIIGCATGYYLAKRGLRVAIVEKGQIGQEQSGRNWGFVRQQGRDPREIPLMIESNRLWRGLSAELGEDVGWRQGGNLALTNDPAKREAFEKWIAAARRHGLKSTLVSTTEIQALLAGSAMRFACGLYTAEDGQADPERVTDAFARAAVRQGASVFENCAVEDFSTTAGRLDGVVAERGLLAAPTVVVAAGAWSGRLLRRFGVRLPQLAIRGTVSRTTPVRPVTPAGVWAPDIAFRQARDGSVILARSGCSDVDLTLEALRYAAVFMPGYLKNRRFFELHVNRESWSSLMRAMVPVRGKRQFREVRTWSPAPHEQRAAEALQHFRQMFPDIRDVGIARTWAGAIDLTPDIIPVLGPVAGKEGLVLATGLSGHGFGMGPIVGRLTAELIADGRPSLPLSEFALERFSAGPIRNEAVL